MTELKKMYEGKINSPETYLRDGLVSGGNVIYLMDDSILPNLPNLLVIGNDQTAETVLVTKKRSDGGYDVQRAVQGNAKNWSQGTIVARNFTEYDYKQLIENINLLNEKKVEVVEGQSLSTNDYDDEAKSKVDAIPENPVYTDTVTTINGKTGAITKEDIVALGLPAKDTIAVASVNGKTGSVNLSKADIGLPNVENIGIKIITEAQYSELSTEEQSRADIVYFVK